MRGSVQKRGKGKWRLVFDLERNHTGRRRQRVVTYQGNKKGADTELVRLISEMEHGGFVEPHKLTVAEYLDRWLENHAAAGISPKTNERYSEICRNHISPALGKHRLVKLAPMHIQSAYSKWLKSRRPEGTGAPVGPKATADNG